jgi:hypothetical protein
LRHTLLRRQGDITGRHGHGQRPIGQRHEVLAHRLIDGLQGLSIGGEHLVQRFPKILEQMKTVRDLRGVGRALACTLGIRTRPIPCDHLHPGMLPEPLRDSVSRAIWE